LTSIRTRKGAPKVKHDYTIPIRIWYIIVHLCVLNIAFLSAFGSPCNKLR